MTEHAWFQAPNGQWMCHCEERGQRLLCETCAEEMERERQFEEFYEWEPT